MANITASAAYDMDAYLPYGHGFGIADNVSSTKLVIEWQGDKSTMLGQYAYSPAFGITSGNFHTFTEAQDGKTILKITGMNVPAANFFLFMTSVYQDNFNNLVYAGNDTFSGSSAGDTLFGMTGRDSMFGRGGHDILKGGVGKDKLFGGAGNDTIEGGTQGDTLKGDDGKDALDGGAGADSLWGGKAADVFVFSRGGGKDTIFDLKLSQGDKLSLSPQLGEFGDTAADIVRDHARVVNGKMVLTFGDGDVLTLNGVTSITALINRGLIDNGDDLF